LARIPQANFDEFVADFRNVEATKHLLQTAIEAMVDVCAHFVARLRLQAPENGARLVQVLAGHGWLPPENVSTYVNMIRFRNLVVHLYSTVDDRRVYEILRDHLDDFRAFIVDAWGIVKRGKAKS
jgi:uncharacterized protein YutE (UPF0331/DUF86 family)